MVRSGAASSGEGAFALAASRDRLPETAALQSDSQKSPHQRSTDLPNADLANADLPANNSTDALVVRQSNEGEAGHGSKLLRQSLNQASAQSISVSKDTAAKVLLDEPAEAQSSSVFTVPGQAIQKLSDSEVQVLKKEVLAMHQSTKADLPK